MIRENKPLSMSESLDIIKKSEADNTEIMGFIKKFLNLKEGQGEEIREKIEELGLLKVKKENIAKIIDLMPENQEDINKIFEDVSLDENEANKILDIIKQYK